MQQFIRRCLSYRKEARPDILTLCDDPFLRPSPKKQSQAHTTTVIAGAQTPGTGNIPS